MAKEWIDYDIGVPFGNPNYDVALGGSHDMTFLTPPNTLIFQIAEGYITDISTPDWGEQVTIELKHAVNGHKYFAILHLAAVNPDLKVGDFMKIGDTVGWSGGCTADHQYDGTSNPTGHNFLNSVAMSSRPQVGIALCDGPKYGGVGWKIFPPIDQTLYPMPVVNAYRKLKADPPDDVKMEQFKIEWVALKKGLALTTGIAKQAFNDFASGHDRGPATTGEFKMPLWDGKTYTVQFTTMGFYSWDTEKGQARWHAFRGD